MSTNIINTPLQDITSNSIPAKRSPSPVSPVGTSTGLTPNGVATNISNTVVTPLATATATNPITSPIFTSTVIPAAATPAVTTPASATMTASPGTAGVTGLSPENPASVVEEKSQIATMELWFFIIFAIIILIICFAIAYNEMTWYNDLNKYTWANNMWVIGIILVIVVLIFAYVSFAAYMKSADSSMKYAIIITYTLSLFLLLVWFAVFFRMKQTANAWYLALFLLFLSFVQVYFIWSVDSSFGAGVVPYMLFMIFLSVIVWNIDTENTV